MKFERYDVEMKMFQFDMKYSSMRLRKKKYFIEVQI